MLSSDLKSSRKWINQTHSGDRRKIELLILHVSFHWYIPHSYVSTFVSSLYRWQVISCTFILLADGYISKYRCQINVVGWEVSSCNYYFHSKWMGWLVFLVYHRMDKMTENWGYFKLNQHLFTSEKLEPVNLSFFAKKKKDFVFLIKPVYGLINHTTDGFSFYNAYCN